MAGSWSLASFLIRLNIRAVTPTPRDYCHWEVQPILLSAPLIIRLNHFCWVGHNVTVILAMLNKNAEPFFIPIGEDSHADQNMLLGFLIK